MTADNTSALHAAMTGTLGRQLIATLDTTTLGQSELGGKGESLVRLRQANLPVPDAFILTTEAFRLFLRENGLTSPLSVEAIRNGKFPGSLRNEIQEKLSQLNSSLFAIRSSAADEDGKEASFAGQYLTVLNCSSLEEVCGAVVDCWASVTSDGARHYRQDRRGGSGEEMAVIVQEMVPADAAGVIFTAHPVSGDRDILLVNSVRGLGDRLVSGEVTPEERMLHREKSVNTGITSDILSEEELTQLKAHALRIEEAFEEPQDIEWATARGKVYILQARPITTISDIQPIPMKIEIPVEGRWERDDIHNSRPVSPFFASVIGPILKEGFKAGFDAFGILFDGVDFRFIGGYPYMRIIPPMGKEGPPPPAFLMKLLLKVVPPLRKKVQIARKAINEDLAGKLITTWHNEWRPKLTAYVEGFQELDLANLNQSELKREYHRAIEMLREAEMIHFGLTPPHFISVTDVMYFCKEELGWEYGKTTGLLSGLSTATSEGGRALAILTKEAGRYPSVLSLLAHPSTRTYKNLKQTSPYFAKLLEEYLKKWGVQVPCYDIDQPTHFEQPELILAWIAGQLEQNYDPATVEQELKNQRSVVIEEARQTLKGRPEKEQEFERLLGRLEQAYPLRDDNGWFERATISTLRLTVVEIGRRMTDCDHLTHSDDIVFLHHDEVAAWLEKPEDQRDRVRHRKGERLWAASQTFPSFYGPESDDPPDLAVFPAELRRVMRGLFWFIENDIQPQLSSNGEGTISGTGASAGIYTGPVRVIKDETAFDQVQPGDVMVCAMTNPAWATLFSTIGALVVDAGGLLSHPAIIAREFGVPAVLATGNATNLLKNGEIVTVDGNAGTVIRTSLPKNTG